MATNDWRTPRMEEARKQGFLDEKWVLAMYEARLRGCRCGPHAPRVIIEEDGRYSTTAHHPGCPAEERH